MLEFLNPVDRNELRERVKNAEPFPHIVIDNLLQEDFANDVYNAFPSYEDSAAIGVSHKSVNQKGKYQVTDSETFPEPVKRLNEALASQDFLDLVSEIMGIPNMLADEELSGGGIHQTGPRGILDVHVDFNYIEPRQLHRRANILVYFNKGWEESWGGNVELWDNDVKKCYQSVSPIFNRCVIFETSEISWHGVTAVHCPKGMSRKSFAAYYYTKEEPAHWTGEYHSTIFKARPDEVIKKNLLMPTQNVLSKKGLKRGIKKLIGK